MPSPPFLWRPFVARATASPGLVHRPPPPFSRHRARTHRTIGLLLFTAVFLPKMDENHPPWFCL